MQGISVGLVPGEWVPDVVSVGLVRIRCFELIPRPGRQPRLVVPEDSGSCAPARPRVDRVSPGSPAPRRWASTSRRTGPCPLRTPRGRRSPGRCRSVRRHGRGPWRMSGRCWNFVFRASYWPVVTLGSTAWMKIAMAASPGVRGAVPSPPPWRGGLCPRSAHHVRPETASEPGPGFPRKGGVSGRRPARAPAAPRAHSAHWARSPRLPCPPRRPGGCAVRAGRAS